MQREGAINWQCGQQVRTDCLAFVVIASLVGCRLLLHIPAIAAIAARAYAPHET